MKLIMRIECDSIEEFELAKKIFVDASLLYIEGLKRTDTNLETQFGGTYKSKAVVPGIAVSYIF